MENDLLIRAKGISKCMPLACLLFASTVLCSATIPLSTWKPLLSERPSEKIQKDIIKRGAEWEIHHVEDQPSYLNLDYYSLRVSKLPNKPGTTNQMTRSDLLNLLAGWIMEKQRPSAERIVFEPADTDVLPGQARIGFPPEIHSICLCSLSQDHGLLGYFMAKRRKNL